MGVVQSTSKIKYNHPEITPENLKHHFSNNNSSVTKEEWVNTVGKKLSIKLNAAELERLFEMADVDNSNTLEEIWVETV